MKLSKLKNREKVSCLISRSQHKVSDNLRCTHEVPKPQLTFVLHHHSSKKIVYWKKYMNWKKKSYKISTFLKWKTNHCETQVCLWANMKYFAGDCYFRFIVKLIDLFILFKKTGNRQLDLGLRFGDANNSFVGFCCNSENVKLMKRWLILNNQNNNLVY